MTYFLVVQAITKYQPIIIPRIIKPSKSRSMMEIQPIISASIMTIQPFRTISMFSHQPIRIINLVKVLYTQT